MPLGQLCTCSVHSSPILTADSSCLQVLELTSCLQTQQRSLHRTAGSRPQALPFPDGQLSPHHFRMLRNPVHLLTSCSFLLVLPLHRPFSHGTQDPPQTTSGRAPTPQHTPHPPSLAPPPGSLRGLPHNLVPRAYWLLPECDPNGRCPAVRPRGCAE